MKSNKIDGVIWVDKNTKQWSLSGVANGIGQFSFVQNSDYNIPVYFISPLNMKDFGLQCFKKGQIANGAVDLVSESLVSEILNKFTAEDCYTTIEPKDISITMFSDIRGSWSQVSSGVRLVHNPTGIVVECNNHRSPHANKHEAMTELHRLLNSSEGRVDKLISRSELIDAIKKMGRYRVGPDPDYQVVTVSCEELLNLVSSL